MQSKGGILFFLILLVSPVIAILSDQQIFFVIMSIIVALVSFKYIYSLLSGNGFNDRENSEELEEELEDLIGIDIRLLGTGMSVLYNMLVILFLIYCAFFLDTILLKTVTAFAILLQIHFIIKKVRKIYQNFNKNQYKLQILLSSLLNLTVILLAAINKISGLY